MPSFHHSIAIDRWPFAIAVVPFRYTVAVVPFHSDDAVAADWLSIYGRMAKTGFSPVATERQLWCNGRWQQQICSGIFHVSNGILTALT